MAQLVQLNPSKTGRQAQDLENKLRRLVVGQEDAIREIVKSYQGHLTGLSPAGRSGTFCSWVRPGRARLALSRRRPNPC